MCIVAYVITAWYSQTCKLGATLTPVSKFSNHESCRNQNKKAVIKVSIIIIRAV
jgi:hypothetical protein